MQRGKTQKVAAAACNSYKYSAKPFSLIPTFLLFSISLAATLIEKMGRGKFKGKPTGHRHFSTHEEMGKKPPSFSISLSLSLSTIIVLSSTVPSADWLACCSLSSCTHGKPAGPVVDLITQVRTRNGVS